MQAPSYPKPPFLATDTGRLALGAVIGLAVAVYITMGMQAPTRWTVAFIVLLLCPFLAILSQDTKRFFTGFMIFLAIPASMSRKMLVQPIDGFILTNGIGVGPLDFALIVLYSLWGIRMLTNPEERKKLDLFSGFNRVAFVYVGVHFVSVFTAVDRMLSLFEMTTILRAMLVFFWVSHNIRSRQEHRYLTFFILLAVMFQGALVISQYFHILPFGIRGLNLEVTIHHEVFLHGRLYSRPMGTFIHGNILGLYLSMSIPFAFTLLFQPGLDRWFRLYCWSAFIIGVFALLISFSRSSWLSMALSCITILILHYRNIESRKWVMRTIKILAMVLVAAVIWHWTPLMDRIFHSDPTMLTERWAMNRDALRMWSDHFILGVGTNNYYMVLLRDYLLEGPLIVVHNIYLIHAAEMGIVGLAAFFFLMFTFFRKALRLTRVQDTYRSSIAIALTGIAPSILGEGVFDFCFKWPVIFYLFWALAGWMVALERCKEEESA